MGGLPERVYTPESQLRHPLRLARAMLADLAASRELALRLAVRDISAQYRQAALGLLWILIIPAVNAAIWILLRRSGVVTIGDTGVSYAAWVLAGTMLWAVFSDSVMAPLQQVTAARALLAKIDLPREALVLSGIVQVLFNSAIRIPVLLIALALMGTFPGSGAWLFPLGLLSLVLAGTAIGLLLVPVGVLYTDVNRALPLLLQVAMYLTPVVFPVPQSGLARTLYELNPITPIVVTAREWLLGGEPVPLLQFAAVNAVLLLVLAATALLYRLAMPIVIERMSA